MANNVAASQAIAEQLGTETISIEIGREGNARTFSVHKNLLSIKCPSFYKAINDELVDGKALCGEPFNMDIKSFELFLGWLYQDKLNLGEAGESEYEMMENSSNLLILADIYEIDRLGDEVMDIICQYRTELGSHLDPFQYISTYEKVSEESGFREYLASAFACAICDGEGEGIDTYDITEALTKSLRLCEHVFDILRREGGNIAHPASESKCQFHYHNFYHQPCPYGGPGR